MAKIKVDIGVACSGAQTPAWWSALLRQMLAAQRNKVEIAGIYTISSALPDYNKNGIVTWNPFEKNRAGKTDANRVGVTSRFMEGKSDYLFFFDDDTVHPNGTLEYFLKAGRDFIAGVYFNPAPPHNPIAYTRKPDGMYQPVMDYPRGLLVQVDAVGMGCTLIHRSVFERIQAGHTVFQRSDGTLLAIDSRNVRAGEPDPQAPDIYYSDGEIRFKAKPINDNEGGQRSWPFFGMEYGRTEDFWFCELADHVGIKPWLDTSVECDHIKNLPINGKDYWGVIMAEKAKSFADASAEVVA